MFNTKLKMTAFSLLSVFAAASAHANQTNQEDLRFLPTNTVLEGAPLYSSQQSKDKIVTTYLNTSDTSANGELHLLPTFSVLEGDTLYSYQEVFTNVNSAKVVSKSNGSSRGELALLPTNSVLEGDALYSYQVVKTKEQNTTVYTEVTKSNNKVQEAKTAC